MERMDLLTHTADVAAAYLSHNTVPVAEVGAAIAAIGLALGNLGEPVAEEPVGPTPAVNPRKSVKHDHIVSLLDGKPYKMLKRHIGLHGYTPESYREAFGLARDYPMVAPAYADVRRDLAKRIGLGRNPNQRRGRRKKAA